MRKFKDAGKPVLDDNGMPTGERTDVREWVIDLTTDIVVRSRKAWGDGFNLLDHEIAPSLWEFSEFYELLWNVVEPQAIAAGVSAAEFGQRLQGQCLFQSRELFWQEWRDFFRALQQEDRALVLDEMLKANAAALKALREKLSPSFVQNMDSKIERSISSRLNRAFADAEGKLDSLLGDIPGKS